MSNDATLSPCPACNGASVRAVAVSGDPRDDRIAACPVCVGPPPTEQARWVADLAHPLKQVKAELAQTLAAHRQLLSDHAALQADVFRLRRDRDRQKEATAVALADSGRVLDAVGATIGIPTEELPGLLKVYLAARCLRAELNRLACHPGCGCLSCAVTHAALEFQAHREEAARYRPPLAITFWPESPLRIQEVA